MLGMTAVFLLCLANLSQAQEEATVNYYVNLITEAYKNGLTYEWPTSAEEFQAKGEREGAGWFDFVVIGSGSGGSVVANRLTENPKWKVLVLEAGVPGDNLTDIPDMYTPVEFTKYNWAYNSTRQNTCCLGVKDQVCYYPRGKALGGTTVINGEVYARGYKSDFDTWEKIVNNSRWGYDSVLRYFKKSENFVHNDPEASYDPAYHGTGGYLNVEYRLPRSPQLNAFLNANQELGYKIADYNANELGVSQSQFNTIHGRRDDGAKAFLRPIQKRKNLKILTSSFVTKIRIDKVKRVSTGVEFNHNGKKYLVKVRKEVILCAGAIGSPQILMLSGIGPRKHLEESKIEVFADLAVGNNLLDNPTFFGITVKTNYTEPIKPLSEYVKEYLNGTGPLSIPNNNAGVGFYESSYSKCTGSPDIELEFIPANATSELSQRAFGFTDEIYSDLWKNVDVPRSFIIYVINLHAVSSGTIKLKSDNPYEYPSIDSKLISDPAGKDIDILYEGIQLVLRLLETKAFKAINATLQGGPLTPCKQHQYLSKDYWYCALRLLTLNLYHPLGTCAMGTDPKKGAVVDSELRVFGIRNLRVADASVFPRSLAGHPNAPTVMVGEQLGDLVKLTYKNELN